VGDKEEVTAVKPLLYEEANWLGARKEGKRKARSNPLLLAMVSSCS
jgi:hypothetical protein